MKQRRLNISRRPADPSVESCSAPPIPRTKEEEAQEILVRTEVLLRPIYLVFQTVNQLVFDLLKSNEKNFDEWNIEAIVKPVARCVEEHTAVEAAELEGCLARNGMVQLNSISLECYLLDRSSSIISILEREKRKKCIMDITEAIEKLPILVVNTVAVRMFERDVLDGIKGKVITLDTFLNRANDAIAYFERRKMHLGHAIYHRGLAKGLDLHFYDNESLGPFAASHSKDKSNHRKETTPSKMQTNRGMRSNDISLISITTLAVFFSTLIGYFAWPDSSEYPGHTSDPGFWYTCQNVILQMTQVVVFLSSDLRKDIFPLKTKVWALVLVGVTAALLIASIPLFVSVPTKFSSMAALAGAVGQVVLTLQLPLAWRKYSSSLQKKSE